MLATPITSVIDLATPSGNCRTAAEPAKSLIDLTRISSRGEREQITRICRVHSSAACVEWWVSGFRAEAEGRKERIEQTDSVMRFS